MYVYQAGKATPIQALPPASQIDVAVLDALPLELKRELERAYGAKIRCIGSTCCASTKACQIPMFPTCFAQVWVLSDLLPTRGREAGPWPLLAGW